MKFAYLPEERPVVYQIFDNEPERLLKVALQLQDLGPDIIDINMGCSVRRVSRRGAGAGLLRSPKKVARIIRDLNQELSIPVSVKIRLGWDDSSRNYLLIARIVEENGAALIAVHGRTKTQGYNGEADWDAIAEIKGSVSIPVIGNGDVRTVQDIERIKKHTGCDAVMIGRAAIGNPWIFSRLDREYVSKELIRETMLIHLERMLAFYGEERGLVLFRKHASRYLSSYFLPQKTRVRLLTEEKPSEAIRLINSIEELVW
jgi:nifR3 family TIM-barrel protein